MKKLNINTDLTHEELQERVKNMTYMEFLELSIISCKGCKGFGKCHQETQGSFGTIVKTSSGPQIAYGECNKKYGYSQTYGIHLDDYLDLHGKEDVIKLFNDNQASKNNKGMFLYGPNEGGKTYVMCNMADRTRKLGHSITLVSWSKLCNDLFKAMEEKNFGYTMAKFENVDVLFIDDLGAGGMTKFKVNDVLFTILDQRKKQNLPTYITCNYAPQQLQEVLSKVDGDVYTGRRPLARIKQTMAYVNISRTTAEIIIDYDT